MTDFGGLTWEFDCVTKKAAQLRREQRAELKRTEILDAARKLFLDNDFSSVTMEAVASEALIARVTLYQYFPTKMDLFGCILIRDMDQLVNVMQNSVDPSSSATKNLENASESYLRFFKGKPEYFKKFSFYFLPGREMELPEELTLELEGRFRGGIAIIQNCIAKGVESGEIREVDPKTAALAHWNLLMGAAYATVTGYGKRQNVDETAVAQFGYKNFIEGLVRG
jgi:AcrR family transcriptional regulator